MRFGYSLSEEITQNLAKCRNVIDIRIEELLSQPISNTYDLIYAHHKINKDKKTAVLYLQKRIQVTQL